MKKKIFGFDLGIASIGWSAIEFDNEYYNIETGEVIEGRILGTGVRTFPVAENPKDGASLALPRREKRLARRICRRKVRRMEGIKKLFIAKNLINTTEQLNDIYAQQIGGDVWNLRVDALSRPLTKEELVRVLTHIAKHRGFKSYRKAVEEKDKEGGKVLKAINENKALLVENKTLAQIIVERAGLRGKKRNYTAKNAKGINEAVYINSIPRTEVERELELIYNVQKQYGIFSPSLFDDFKHIAFRYRPVGSVGDMVGNCSFEPNEKRAPKNAPSAELFVALSKINNLKIYENNEKRPLNDDERHDLLNLLKNTQKVKYSSISSKVFKNRNIQFAGIDYSATIKKAKDGSIKVVNPEDILFYEMKGWHQIKAILQKDELQNFYANLPLFDKIVNVIACKKNDVNITKGLRELGLDDNLIKRLLGLDFDKFINLSLKALYKIIPYMEQGLTYDKACEEAGYDFKNIGSLVASKGIFLPPILPDKQTKVPVVNRTVAQFRKVFNAMVRKFGLPDQINIETGRELKKTFDERKDIKKKIEENESQRTEAAIELKNKDIDDTSTNILKYRLYQEQDGKCIYSGSVIDINRLDEHGYLEVDHIIPYSRSFDNSYQNKVLCLSSENQKKGNRTPFEYITSDKWAEFECRVNSMQAMKRIKKDKLLTKNYIDRELEFKDRNANDNSYIAKYVKQYLENGIDFASSPRQDIKNRVRVRTGFLTDYLRHSWGLTKDRNENDRHHAQDAIVVACATEEMVRYLSTVSGLFENKMDITKEKGEAWYKSLKQKFREPWCGFRDEVIDNLNRIFVSRPPRKGATGEIHLETIYTLNPNNKNYDEKNTKSGLKVRGGIAGNGAMLRTDVFAKKNKKGKDEFYLVPIYLSDMGKELPNKAIVPLKLEDEWIQIDDSFEFKFSLYMDDLIKTTKGDSVIFGYYKGTGRTTGSITIESHDRSSITPSIGVKTLDKIQKYIVDVLGNYTEVKKETRLPLTNKKKDKQRRLDRLARKAKEQ